MVRTVALIVMASLSIVLVIGGGQAVAAKGPAPLLRSLVRRTSAIPRSVLHKPQRGKLRRAAIRARRAAKKRPCVAVSALGRFRTILAKVKVKRSRRLRKATARLAALGPASLKASQRLLASRRTKRCGGGVAPSTRGEVKTTVMKSDENGMVLHVALPKLNFVPETGGGKSWTKLTAPDTDSPGAPGSPGIPIAGSTLGVPDGATLSVKADKTKSYSLQGVEVFPAQPDTVDLGSNDPPPNIFAPPYASKPFTMDKDAYGTDAFFPSAPALGNMLGTSRDIVIGGLQIPSAQYNPVTNKLKVLTTVDLTLNFNGGPHTFSDYLGSPWEQAQSRVLASLLNYSFLRTRFFPDILRRCGEEMLVITNPTTLAAANQFATARRAAGIRTAVVQTGAGAGQIGTTNTAIQTFIRNELTAFLCIHPSYVTIMGDDELVPTFPDAHAGIPSDLPYAKKNDADDLPDVAVGRILGADLNQVTTAVSKIVNYETNPPTGDFLRHALIAAQFQDDNADGREERTFVQFAETVRTGLVNRGLSVDRVYQDAPTTTPLKFNDGTDLPAALKKPAFPWTGTAADVTAGWNAGRFMVIHRDHGWSDGWSHPGFTTTEVDALTNGSKLPVVLSVNCSSAAYDYDETSFTQNALVKSDGGAVGVFGDTRDSPTWHNTQLALGFVDGMLPSVLPAEGPALKQRVGDALINGKLRLAGLAPPATDGSTVNELFLWHYFGDPSMQMWGGNPVLVLDPGRFRAIYRELPPRPGDPPPYEVFVTLPTELVGQPISLLRNGQTIGKATVNGDGTATIPAAFGDGSVKPGELRVAMEPDGAQPINVPVEDVPKTPTSMTQECPSEPVPSGGNMTVSGTLSPALAGVNIVITYTRPDQTTFDRTVQTDANGAWTNTITPQSEATGFGVGTWNVKARYAGDDTRAASSTAGCTVEVFDNS